MQPKKESLIVPVFLKGTGETDKDALIRKKTIKKMGKKLKHESMAETVRFCVDFTFNNVKE